MKRFITHADVQHGDFPWCHVEWMSNPALVGAKELLLVRATFPPGQAHNFHRHPAREEIIYVTEGRAEQWVGREKHLLAAGFDLFCQRLRGAPVDQAQRRARASFGFVSDLE